MASLPDYAELHCLSNFSFLRGASHPHELVERAAALGYRALALTDECSLAGVVRAHRAARAYPQLQLLVGSEFRLSDGTRLVMLACNREGYGNLSALITLARRRAPKGQYQLTRGDFAAITPRGAVPDCLVLWVPDEDSDDSQNEDTGRWVARIFPDRAWLAVALHAGQDDADKLASLTNLAHDCGLRLVAAGEVHMHERARRPLQDVLTALRLKTSVFQAGQALFPNGERHLRTRLRLARLYPAELLAETLRVAARCHFSLAELAYEYPEEVVPVGHTPSSWLRHETTRGLHLRYPDGVPSSVNDRVRHELDLIAELGYEPYFLTVHDLVRFARNQGILCQGRGSAANSAVCYALGITEVDPARSSLLFERFISKERGEPPDIDVDFEHERRQEVIDYIYQRYGQDRAALAAAVITYRSRSALRDVGRALGFEMARIDALTSSLAWWETSDADPARREAAMRARFAEQGLDPDSPRVAKWQALAWMLRGFPRHLTQHVGGFVISRGPLARLVPIENTGMDRRSIIEWDKDDLDALGLLKVDVLALGMLSAIRRTLAYLSCQTGKNWSMADIPAEDPAVYRMLGKADSMGVFQVESRAQMAMLPRLKPRCFYDLVVEVAIVRPGPIQGDMVHPYLRRRAGQERIERISPSVDAVLARTCGVPIFQEQVMALAVVAAGFTPGEADQLRRAMAAWRRKGGLEPFEAKLIAGMRERGLPEGFAQRLFAQIRGFGEYGFPESHAASFALLVYVSAWLKCHHPAAFLCGLLNSQPMGFYSPSQLVQDAQRHGVEVLPADINHSDWDSQPLNRGRQVRLGLHLVRGLSQAAGEKIAMHRPYDSIHELLMHTGLGQSEISRLASADALRSLAGHRYQAAWEATAHAGKPLQGDLFAAVAPPIDSGTILKAPKAGAELVADFRHLGLSLRQHPLALLRPALNQRCFVLSTDLPQHGNAAIIRVAGLVTCRQRPGTASGVIFLTLEDEGGWLNVVVPAHLAARQRKAVLAGQLLGVFGQLQSESGVIHLLAGRFVDLSHWLGNLPVISRDFH